jgi:hypothetical protein
VRITQICGHQICDFSDQITGVHRLWRLLFGLGGLALVLNPARSRGLDAGRASLKGSLPRDIFIIAYARILLLNWSCVTSPLSRRATVARLYLGALRFDADAQRVFEHQLSDQSFTANKSARLYE